MDTLSTNGKRSIGKKISGYDDYKTKTLLVISLTVIIIAMFLSFPILSYQELNINVSESYTGIELIEMFLTNNYTIEINVTETISFNIELPKSIVTILFSYFILLIINLLIIFYFGMIKRKDVKNLGLTYFFLAISLFGVYLFCIISSNLTAVNRMGTVLEFYRVYNMGVVLILSSIMLAFTGGIQYFLKINSIKEIKRFWFIYSLLIVPTILMIVFSYYPIFLQFIISFKDYKFSDGIWGSKWAGLKYIERIFTDPEIASIAFISIKLSIYRLFVSIIPPLTLAILLFDMGKPRMRKAIQTIVYIPHFFSWVVIYGIFYAFLSNTGVLNQVIKLLSNSSVDYIDFLTNPNNIIPTLLISQVWKEIGWGTILYLAALSNIDPSLYEAASIDGAGPLKRLWHITLPSLMSLVIFLALLQIGAILANGLEQILLFANLAVRDRVYTIELWVYRNGIGKLDYGISSAVGFVQSLIGLILVLACNKLSIKTVGRGLW